MCNYHVVLFFFRTLTLVVVVTMPPCFLFNSELRDINIIAHNYKHIRGHITTRART